MRQKGEGILRPEGVKPWPQIRQEEEQSLPNSQLPLGLCRRAPAGISTSRLFLLGSCSLLFTRDLSCKSCCLLRETFLMPQTKCIISGLSIDRQSPCPQSGGGWVGELAHDWAGRPHNWPGGGGGG